MTTRSDDGATSPLIESKDDLIASFAGGEKPAARWRIGTEHEKFVFWKDSYRAPSYEEPGGIHALLIGLTRYGWKPIYEGDNVIALEGPDGNVSLEDVFMELTGHGLEDEPDEERHLAANTM